jgi:hypothetical protein
VKVKGTAIELPVRRRRARFGRHTEASIYPETTPSEGITIFVNDPSLHGVTIAPPNASRRSADYWVGATMGRRLDKPGTMEPWYCISHIVRTLCEIA